MDIKKFSEGLLKIYQEMGNEFSSYQNQMGLGCLAGCGRCCLNPEVEASTLEMIPLALNLYSQGKAETTLQELKNTTQNYCLMYKATSPDGLQGGCGVYEFRPSLCRMFGASGFFNKENKKVLSLCKFIREHHASLAQQIENNLEATNPPMMRDWSAKMMQYHPDLIMNKMPINQALIQAIEKILLLAQYGNEL